VHRHVGHLPQIEPLRTTDPCTQRHPHASRRLDLQRNIVLERGAKAHRESDRRGVELQESRPLAAASPDRGAVR